MKLNYFLAAGLAVLLYLPIACVSAQDERTRPTPRLTTDDVKSRNTSSILAASNESDKSANNTLPATEPRPASGSISWERSLSQALQTARAEDKLIVVDVYTDWCGWCKKMDANIYANPLIVGLSQQEVFLKLDAEDGDEGQEFARRMGVRGFPTTIVLNDKGHPIAAQRGYISSPRAFIDLVKRARQNN